jgi:hypothetical protein
MYPPNNAAEAASGAKALCNAIAGSQGDSVLNAKTDKFHTHPRMAGISLLPPSASNFPP